MAHFESVKAECVGESRHSVKGTSELPSERLWIIITRTTAPGSVYGPAIAILGCCRRSGPAADERHIINPEAVVVREYPITRMSMRALIRLLAVVAMPRIAPPPFGRDDERGVTYPSPQGPLA